MSKSIEVQIERNRCLRIRQRVAANHPGAFPSDVDAMLVAISRGVPADEFKTAHTAESFGQMSLYTEAQ
jgi:hypothetical protein